MVLYIPQVPNEVFLYLGIIGLVYFEPYLFKFGHFEADRVFFGFLPVGVWARPAF